MVGSVLSNLFVILDKPFFTLIQFPYFRKVTHGDMADGKKDL